MTVAFHRTLFLQGPVGRLEAMLWTTPASDPRFVAVVCHPHPLYGGTMHNKVVYRAAQALHQCGAPVLRFNFRGAGLSDGAHDNGRGEEGDVRATLDYLAQQFPERPILLAGFSFGSWVGLRVGCVDARVTKLIGLGLPVDTCDFTYLYDCKKPKLIVQGGNDPYGSRPHIEALFETLTEPKRILVVEGADHFFAGRLPEVSAAIKGWVEPNE